MVTLNPSRSRYYRPELDVVRLLAFLTVFLHHILPHTPGPRAVALLKGAAPFCYSLGDACRFGLSLFFTLSAFLICELLLREFEATGTIGIKQFYIRRILRIWPLYYLGLALGVVVALLPGGNPGQIIHIGWFAIFMGAWYSAICGWLPNPMNVLWSISVEEQFYLFTPWIVKYLSRNLLYGVSLGVILVANIRLYYLGAEPASDNRIWADSFVQFECFAAGILLCLILRGRLPRIAIWQRVMLIAGSGSCWFIASYGLHIRFHNAVENPGSWPLIGGYAMAALGSVLVLIAFLGVNPKLLPRGAIYLGRISYGLYVYHQFAIYIASRLLTRHVAISALGMTIVTAMLSYRYVETPFLNLKKRYSVVESQPA